MAVYAILLSGMCFTTNIVMLMDTVGPAQQAIGFAVSKSLGSLAAALTTYIAASVTIPQAFLFVLICSVLGLVIS